MCIRDSPEALAETVTQIFRKYEEWNQALFESRMMNGSIQNLLDLTGSIISNPSIVISMDFTIIASRNSPFGELATPVLGSTENTADQMCIRDRFYTAVIEKYPELTKPEA